MKWITTVAEFLAAQQRQGQGLRVQFTVWDENDLRAHTLIGSAESPAMSSSAVEEGGTTRSEDFVWPDITIVGDTHARTHTTISNCQHTLFDLLSCTLSICYVH